jgi:hypothetical protein
LGFWWIIAKRTVVPRSRAFALLGALDTPALVLAGMLLRDSNAILGLLALCWLELLAAPLGYFLALVLGNVKNATLESVVGAGWVLVFGSIALIVFLPGDALDTADPRSLFGCICGGLALIATLTAGSVGNTMRPT